MPVYCLFMTWIDTVSEGCIHCLFMTRIDTVSEGYIHCSWHGLILSVKDIFTVHGMD